MPSPSAALSISADADTGDCFAVSGSECVGGLYGLTVSQVDADTWRATLTMDFGSQQPLYDLDVARNYIKDVVFKVSNDYFDPIVVTSAPGGDKSNWVPRSGVLGGNGCGGTNDSFVCLDAVNDLVIGSTKTLSWSVDFDLRSADQLLDESDWHIGARFGRINPANGKEQTALLSAYAPGSAPIPEPTSALLFGAGLLIVGAFARRRFN